MSNTASVRIYQIREDTDISQLIVHITDDLHYSTVQFHEQIQRQQGVKIQAFVKDNYSRPSWFRMVSSYMTDTTSLTQFRKYDFIALIFCKSSKEREYVFAFCGGIGYQHIAEYINYAFGISVLESIYDPTLNKIKSVAEKGIIGDILSSRRFYRRARSFAYEHDFGKYYQNIDARFHESQIKQKLPKLAAFKGGKLKPNVTISGSASVEIKMKINFLALVFLLKDLSELLTVEHPIIFNKTLIPLDAKRDKEKISQLNEEIFENLVDYDSNPEKYSMDFVFCHREFEAFYSSASCQVIIPELTDAKGEEIEPVGIDDVYDLSDLSYMNEIFERIKQSREYRNADETRSFTKDVLESIRVVTKNDEGYETTTGKFREYLQLEIEQDGVSYFLLDDRWYSLKTDFDLRLKERYESIVSPKFKTYEFIHNWNNSNEAAYNKLYDNQLNSFYLHQIIVDHIELCDALIIDPEQKRTYFIHVKDGIGATIRDLTSQAYIAARIIEDESRTETKDKLKKLYEQAVNRKRVNSKTVSREDFLRWFSSFKREYVLVIHGDNKAQLDIIGGNFESRIAKYSLIEFASTMRVNDWEYSICCVN